MTRKIYAAQSSLTTCRTHLQLESHVVEYVNVVTKYGWDNKLPAKRLKQLVEQRAHEAQRLPFSVQNLTDQLIKVFVSNDLVHPYFLLYSSMLDI